ncbi:MAG: hypothetical protein JW863_24130 [Chitinispirillaceae bacterium]|nr:hypothetical protein [Chitinispirillaceae bacterium]
MSDVPAAVGQQHENVPEDLSDISANPPLSKHWKLSEIRRGLNGSPEPISKDEDRQLLFRFFENLWDSDDYILFFIFGRYRLRKIFKRGALKSDNHG